MTYGTETHSIDLIGYHAHLTHVPSGIKVIVTMDFEQNSDGSFPSEANRDALFQAFLSTMASMANVSFTSAEKRGAFVASVTP